MNMAYAGGFATNTAEDRRYNARMRALHGPTNAERAAAALIRQWERDGAEPNAVQIAFAEEIEASIRKHG